MSGVTVLDGDMVEVGILKQNEAERGHERALTVKPRSLSWIWECAGSQRRGTM